MLPDTTSTPIIPEEAESGVHRISDAIDEEEMLAVAGHFPHIPFPELPPTRPETTIDFVFKTPIVPQITRQRRGRGGAMRELLSYLKEVGPRTRREVLGAPCCNWDSNTLSRAVRFGFIVAAKVAFETRSSYIITPDGEKELSALEARQSADD